LSDPARWISVGELAEAFSPDNYTPPQTAGLAGSEHVLHFEDGSAALYRFVSEAEVAWQAAGAEPGATAGKAHYSAVAPRPGIYFVDFVTALAPPTAVTLVLDLERGIATRLTARLPQSADPGESLAARAARGEELTAVTADFAAAAVDTPFTGGTARHETTDDLIGRRVQYTYSSTERYEHIYLNEHFYTWHCLQGSEKGLADTDRCHYFKLDDDLYLFVWREKIVPTLGAVIVDFQVMRTMGKIFGHAESGVVDFPVGARARLLNVTSHGEAI
jgi:hypothetical protein